MAENQLFDNSPSTEPTSCTVVRSVI